LGTIKRDTQIRAIKIAKDKASHPQSPGRGPQYICLLDLAPKSRLARPHWPRTRVPSRPTPRGSDADTASPDPLGLGRKFRLARPLQGSGTNAASPDKGKAFNARRPYPRHDRRSDSHIAAGHGGDYSNHPGHCSLTSSTVTLPLFTVVYRLTVKGEWERIISITICSLLSLLT